MEFNPTQAHYQQGIEKYQTGNYNEAINNFIIALKENPQESEKINKYLVESYLER